MIIEIDGTGNRVAEAWHRLDRLTRTWGYDLAKREPPPGAATDPGHDKAINPVDLATLTVSLPSAALAVLDLADRIRKRRRAAELIQHARDQSARHVSLRITTRTRTIEIQTLNPDELLDLVDGGNPGD